MKKYCIYSIYGCFVTGAATATTYWLNVVPDTCAGLSLCRSQPGTGQCCTQTNKVNSITLPSGAQGLNVTVGSRTIKLFNADGTPNTTAYADEQIRNALLGATSGGTPLNGSVIPASEQLVTVTLDMKGGSLPIGFGTSKIKSMAVGDVVPSNVPNRVDGAVFKGFGTSLSNANKNVVVGVDATQTFVAQWECPERATPNANGVCVTGEEVIIDASTGNEISPSQLTCWRNNYTENYCKWRGTVHLHPYPNVTLPTNFQVYTFNYASGSGVSSVSPTWTNTHNDFNITTGNNGIYMNLECRGAGCWLKDTPTQSEYYDGDNECQCSSYVAVTNTSECYETVSVLSSGYIMQNGQCYEYSSEANAYVIVPDTASCYENKLVLRPGYYEHEDGTCTKAVVVQGSCSELNALDADGLLVNGCNVVIENNPATGTSSPGLTSGTTPFVYQIPQPKADGYTFRGFYRGNSNPVWIAKSGTTIGGPVMGFVVTNPNNKGLNVGGRAIVEMYDTPVDANAQYDMHLYGAWAYNCDPTSPAMCRLDMGTSWVGLVQNGLGPGDIRYSTSCPAGYALTNSNIYNPSCNAESGTLNLVYHFTDQYGLQVGQDTSTTCELGSGYTMLSSSSFNQTYNGSSNPGANPNYVIRYMKTPNDWYSPGYGVTCSSSVFGNAATVDSTVIVNGYVCSKSDCNDANGSGCVDMPQCTSNCGNVPPLSNPSIAYNPHGNGYYGPVFLWNENSAFELAKCQKLICNDQYNVLRDNDGVVRCHPKCEIENNCD